MPEKFSKWVACWGNATSITDRKEATYAKNLTLRYPIRACFSGSKLRFHFSNLTGTESVQISEAYVAKSVQSSVQPAAQSTNAAYAPTAITFGGEPSATIPAGEEILSDEIPFDIVAGEMFDVSLYLQSLRYYPTTLRAKRTGSTSSIRLMSSLRKRTSHSSASAILSRRRTGPIISRFVALVKVLTTFPSSVVR